MGYNNFDVIYAILLYLGLFLCGFGLSVVVRGWLNFRRESAATYRQRQAFTAKRLAKVEARIDETDERLGR